MQPLCYFSLLCTLSSLSSVLSLNCSDRHYAWPANTPTLCCDKCAPGQRMVKRSEVNCVHQCGPCMEKLYRDTYNEKMSCEICGFCNKPNMAYDSNCNSTHNAVCRCNAGYMYKDASRKQCVPIPPTDTKPTPAPPTTVLKPGLTTAWPPAPQLRVLTDTVWFLVIIALLCAGLAIVFVANIKPFLRWIKSMNGYFLAKEPAPVTACSEDEGVSTPIQEVVGKCECV
ncbi:CD27 antigen-like isoform X2 [Trematomus bernacchii]|nr:CD27 antigen-like isoform X2 [Trematomus bernacchii]